MLNELKKEYNSLLERQNKAINYFQDIKNPELLNRELKRLYPKYNEIIINQHEIKKRIIYFGYNPSEKELLEGFEVR